MAADFDDACGARTAIDTCPLLDEDVDPPLMECGDCDAVEIDPQCGAVAEDAGVGCPFGDENGPLLSSIRIFDSIDEEAPDPPCPDGGGGTYHTVIFHFSCGEILLCPQSFIQVLDDGTTISAREIFRVGGEKDFAVSVGMCIADLDDPSPMAVVDARAYRSAVVIPCVVREGGA